MRSPQPHAGAPGRLSGAPPPLPLATPAAGTSLLRFDLPTPSAHSQRSLCKCREAAYRASIHSMDIPAPPRSSRGHTRLLLFPHHVLTLPPPQPP